MKKLIELLSHLPATEVLSNSQDTPSVDLSELIELEGGRAPSGPTSWWVKLALDLDDHMAWHVVQELAFVLNSISVTERLPTVFMPVSPPPNLNGGPAPFLSWVIEPIHPDVDPDEIAAVLAERLPQPPSDLSQWARCFTDNCPVPALEPDDDELEPEDDE